MVNRVSSSFPKGPLNNPNRTENNLNTHEVCHRNYDIKTRQLRTTTELSNGLLGGGGLNVVPTSPSVSEAVQNI